MKIYYSPQMQHTSLFNLSFSSLYEYLSMYIYFVYHIISLRDFMPMQTIPMKSFLQMMTEDTCSTQHRTLWEWDVQWLIY